MLIFVWAQDENRVIGRDGQLPWHLPSDMQFFKEVTMGNTIVMGRATFEGMGKRLLPKRHTMVVTRQADYDGNGAEVIHDVSVLREDGRDEDLYIIGGAVLFEALKDDVDVLYCTKIHAAFEGDTYFPEDFPWDDFVLAKQMDGTRDAENHYDHTFEIYQRKAGTKDDDVA